LLGGAEQFKRKPKQMRLWIWIKDSLCKKNEGRSPYVNEEVTKIPKAEMMKRIAEVVQADRKKQEQDKKGRDEGYRVGGITID